MRDLDAPLANGATLIDRTAGPRDGENVVLAEVPNTPQPFVTWIEDDAGNTFWGHYFKTLPEARADYDQRRRQAA